MLSANISKETRREVYARDYYRCALCDTPRGLQIHHVIPRSRGGSNDPENLITLCMWCHNAIHGTRWPNMPDWMDKEELKQAAVEYLADYYAGSWYPWVRGQSRYEREMGG